MVLCGALDPGSFNGNEDERQMEEAAAVSSERLQEVLGRLVGSLFAPAVQKLPAAKRTARRSTDRCARLKWPQTKMRGKWRKQQLSPVNACKKFLIDYRVRFLPRPCKNCPPQKGRQDVQRTAARD